eukprot:612458-Rhodomonas_salina.1
MLMRTYLVVTGVAKVLVTSVSPSLFPANFAPASTAVHAVASELTSTVYRDVYHTVLPGLPLVATPEIKRSNPTSSCIHPLLSATRGKKQLFGSSNRPLLQVSRLFRTD